MNSLPLDNPSSPERKEKSSDLVILGCPSCGHRLRLAYQNLGVEGNCVRCRTAIMGVEFSPGKIGAVYVNPPNKESALPMAGTANREVDQSTESPPGSANENSNRSQPEVRPGLTIPVSPPDFGPLPQFVISGSPESKQIGISEELSVSKPDFELTFTGASKPLPFDPPTMADGFGGIDQTPPQEKVLPFGGMTADSAKPLGAPPLANDPSEDGGAHGVVDETPKLAVQFDLFGPPVKDAGESTINHQPSTINHSKNPFVVNLTAFSNSVNPQGNTPPAMPTFVPGVGSSVGTASQNSQPAVQSRGLDDQFSNKLEALSSVATPPQELSTGFHTRDRLVAAPSTPAPQSLAPENEKPLEPVTFPSIKLPKVAPPKDDFDMPRILALLFIFSVITGFGSYMLTPYESKEEIKSQFVEWLGPGSVVIEQLPFGLGKKILD